MSGLFEVTLRLDLSEVGELIISSLFVMRNNDVFHLYKSFLTLRVTL